MANSTSASPVDLPLGPTSMCTRIGCSGAKNWGLKNIIFLNQKAKGEGYKDNKDSVVCRTLAMSDSVARNGRPLMCTKCPL